MIRSKAFFRGFSRSSFLQRLGFVFSRDMNPRRPFSKWLLGLMLLILGGPVLLCSAQSKRIVMETNTVTPLQIVFFSPRAEVLSGRVLADTVLETEPYGIRFILQDKGKAEVWRKMLRWDSEFQREDRVVIPFEFDLRRIPTGGKMFMTAELFDRDENLLASGRGQGLVYKAERPAQLSNLSVKKGEKNVTGSFLFVNNYKSRNAYAEIRVREHVPTGVIVFEKKTDLMNFPAEERKNIPFEINLPEAPETYLVEVEMFDESGDSLTGVVRDRFLVEGDFAEIKAFNTTPEHFLKAGDTVTFHIAGMARSGDEPLSLDVEIDQYKDDEKVDHFVTKKALQSQGGRFREQFAFPLQFPASKFQAHLKVLRGRNVIEEKVIQTRAFKKNTFFESVTQIIQNPTDSKNFEVWMVTILTLAILIALFAFVKGKKQTLNLLILGSALCWAQTGYAAMEVSWTLPQSEVAYSLNETKGFNEIQFDGMVYDEDNNYEGLFDQELVSVNMEFTKEEDEVIVSVPLEDITISEGNTRYEFTGVMTPEDFTDVENVDGQWNMQIAFTVVGDVTYVSAWDGYIVLDTTPPDISFVPALEVNQFEGESIMVSISCDDGEAGAGCLEDTLTTYVRGNFCDDENLCNPEAVRGFEVCDTVGNCTDPDTNKLTITQFDPIPPRLEGGIRFGDGEGLTGRGGFDANRVKARADFIFELLGANDDVDAGRLAEYQDQFDDNACGTEVEQNDTFLAEDVVLSWTAEEEGEDLMGYFIERDEKGGEEVWNQMGSVEVNDTGEYTFEGITTNDANNYLYRLRIGSMGGESYSTSIEIGVPLEESETLGENAIISTITAFSATEGTDRCLNKEIMCVQNHQRNIKDITQQICEKNEFEIQLESFVYGFPYELPFPLSPLPEGTFPLQFPTYLGE